MRRFFRSRNHTIKLPDTSLVKLAVQAMNALRGTKPVVKLWNNRLNCVLENICIKRCASDYGDCIWYYEGDIIILNLSTDEILVSTGNPKALQKVNDTLAI